MKLPVLSKLGDAKRTLEVSDSLFTTETPEALLAQAVRTQAANHRHSTTHTKDRGEVSGGGRKPWRQKGTGRALAGTIRSPLWRGGGVTFGPTAALNHSLQMPKRMRRRALLGALSAKWRAGAVSVMPDFALGQPSCRGFLAHLSSLGLPTTRLTVVIATPDEVTLRSSDNLAGVEVLPASYLTVGAILSARSLVFTESGLSALEEWYQGQAKEEAK